MQLSLHYTSLHYTTLHYTTATTTTKTTTTTTAPLHHTTLHYTTLQYTTLQYTTLHCTNYTTPQQQVQLQLHYTNYTTTTPLHYTTTTTELHHTTSSSCGWGDHCNHCSHSKKTQPQPAFGPSVDSLCHPCITTTKLSYRFPIFETVATALCGTTGIKHPQSVVIPYSTMVSRRCLMLGGRNYWEYP